MGHFDTTDSGAFNDLFDVHLNYKLYYSLCIFFDNIIFVFNPDYYKVVFFRRALSSVFVPVNIIMLGDDILFFYKALLLFEYGVSFFVSIERGSI